MSPSLTFNFLFGSQGTVSLLNILCHQNGRKLVNGRPVRCFAYGCPPVFTPLEFASDAVKSCTSYIFCRDWVPFLSIDSIRRLLASVSVIGDHGLKWRERVKILTGYVEPHSELCKGVSKSFQQRLTPKKGAPVLEIPAAANLWLKPTNSSNEYNFKICDSRKLAQLGLQIDANMLRDHIPTRYEDALHNLKQE